MPQIILDGSGLDVLWVKALMLYPDESEKNSRDRLFAAEQVSNDIKEARDSDLVNVDARTLRFLLDAPSRATLSLEAVTSTKQAIVAGDVLGSLYLMHLFNLPEPSLKKAIFVSRHYAKKTKYGDGSGMAISDTMIRRYWEKYLPVAHLWAAYRIGQAYPFAPERGFFSPEHFQTSLEVAQGVYLFGSQFVPKRARPQLPILNPERCWVLPSSVNPRRLNATTKPDKLINILKKYKAPKA